MPSPRFVALAIALIAGGAPAFAAPEAGTAASSGSASPLVRFQRRLEADATRVLTPEVSGGMKSVLASDALVLWTSLSVAEWRTRLVERAPSLDKAGQVLVRRTEVIWAEERVVDAYGSPVTQLTAVHSLMRGLSKVIESLGVRMPPPPAPPAPTATPRAAPARPPAPVSAVVRPTPPSTYSATIAPRPAARPAPTAPRADTVLSPAQIATMKAALDAEAYRVLSPELGGRALDGVVSRRAEMRAAPTVAAWKRLLSAANPDLSKAGDVLERRAEVLCRDHRVLDAFASPAVQRSAVAGLQSGLDRILRLFGK